MSVARETVPVMGACGDIYDAIRFLTDRLELAGKTATRYQEHRGRSRSSGGDAIAPLRWRID